MPRRWRRATGLLLALLLAAAAAVARLDASRLSASALATLPAWAARITQGGQPEFSLTHGLSLKNVRIHAGDNRWRLHADQVRLSLSFWGLLRGRADIRGVEIVHPTLRLDAQAPLPEWPVGARPEGWSWLRIRQGELITASHRILWSLDATIRRIHDHRELTWEAQALTQGGSLTLQGRSRHGQRGRDVFGSLKIKGARPEALPAAWRTGWPALPERERLDATFTFDMDTRARWSLFGDMRLRDDPRANARPELQWRGKVTGEALARLSWRDAYVRVGKAAFATRGACRDGITPFHFRDCQFDIHAKGADIRPLAALAGIQPANDPARLRGRMDIAMRGTWRGGVWRLSGEGAMRDASWNRIALPDAQLSLGDVQWRPGANRRWMLRDVRITPKDHTGALRLTKGSGRGSQTWHMEARLEQLRDAWVAWGNALLAQWGRPTALQGGGALDGRVDIAFRSDRLQAAGTLDATQAQIVWQQRLNKPAGVHARLCAALTRTQSDVRLRLTALELGSSHVAGHWHWQHGRLRELDVDDVLLMPDALQQQGVLLPEALRGWHGRLEGQMANIHPSPNIDPAWFGSASGRLKLDAFGKTQRVSGMMTLAQGQLRADRLRWRSAPEPDATTLDMDADIRLPAGSEAGPKGRLDILRARLRWNTGDALPVWLTKADLYGQVRDTTVSWLGNDWRIRRARHHLRNGALTLSRLRGALAGGSVQSPEVTLTPEPEGMRFDGLIRMGEVHLGQVRGLATALGAKLEGRLYLNARLTGALPWLPADGWRGNGDLEIRRGRWQAMDARIRLAAGDVILDAGTSRKFARLAARFRFRAHRLQLSRLQLSTPAGRAWSGTGGIYAGGALAGRVTAIPNHATMKLSGVWPELGALLAADAAPSAATRRP